MINVNFVNDYNTVTTAPLYQWDYGRKLVITGLNLPAAVQVHFATKKSETATIFIAYKDETEAEWTVNIPNALLEVGEDINAYIYVTDTGEGKTEKQIIIPIIKRAKPEDFISQPDPDEQAIIDELLEKFSDLVVVVDEYRTFSDVRIMTKAQYQALETKEENVIYAFSDDTTLEEVEAALNAKRLYRHEIKLRTSTVAYSGYDVFLTIYNNQSSAYANIHNVAAAYNLGSSIGLSHRKAPITGIVIPRNGEGKEETVVIPNYVTWGELLWVGSLVLGGTLLFNGTGSDGSVRGSYFESQLEFVEDTVYTVM